MQSRSFCSSNHLADVAARVVQELRLESTSESEFDFCDEEFYVEKNRADVDVIQNRDDNEDEDDDFEFAFVCRESESSPISADEIFYNGQIKPIYPIFNNNNNAVVEVVVDPTKRIRSPLKQLLIEDREATTTTSSCSSSEADELDGVEPGSFCVWTPRKQVEENEKCKKSNSTGLFPSSGKRWKFKRLLYNRSNSDGKDKFVFVKEEKDKEENAITINSNNNKLKNNNRADSVKNNNNHRSYLPYRQELVGIFSNVNGLSRNLHPF